jgi:subtilisin family serine protease
LRDRTRNCNDKLIGVWSWPVITDSFQGVRPPSGEDYNGHGSHTASTVAGNVVNNVPLLGSSLGDGNGTPTGFTFAQVSGVAPHANIVAYQVCFPTGGCPDEAILTAVDQAIQDGVDVINFSIGGSEGFPWNDATALAFLSARESGIAIAASAGNAGPDFYTLSHSAPWYLVVAAASRRVRIFRKQFGLSGTNPARISSTRIHDLRRHFGAGATGRSSTLRTSATSFRKSVPPARSRQPIVVCKR